MCLLYFSNLTPVFFFFLSLLTFSFLSIKSTTTIMFYRGAVSKQNDDHEVFGIDDGGA